MLNGGNYFVSYVILSASDTVESGIAIRDVPDSDFSRYFIWDKNKMSVYSDLSVE